MFAVDQFATLLAQKLATSLVLEDLTAEKLPYLVVLSSHTPTKSVKGINETDKLGWILNPQNSLSQGEVLDKLSQTTVRFDMVESYSASYKGEVTQHKMFSGDVVTDNLVTKNPEYSLTAKISKTSTLSSHSVVNTVDILKEAFHLKYPVYLSLPDISNVPSYGEALNSYGANKDDIYGLITSLEFSRDTSVQDGFVINMNISQVKFASEVKASDTIGLVTENPKGSDADGSKEQIKIDGKSTCISIYDNYLDLARKGGDPDYNSTTLRDKLNASLAKGDTYNNEADCDIDKIVNAYEVNIKEYPKP